MTSLRILVIDDSLTIRKLVEIALRGTAHAIDYGATGAAGVELARATPPDLVLCDFVLPDLRGNEVCRAIAAVPGCEKTALVVMTGKQDQVRGHFAGLRVFDYLSKPFTAAAVQSVVERVGQRRGPSFPATREHALALASSFRAALYEVLCERLARIPSWSSELGAETPATFFARKLFTEPVLAELFESLLPIYQQTRARIHDRNQVAEGSLAVLRPARLLELAVRTPGTSELTFQTERGTTVFFVAGGRLYSSIHAPSPATDPVGLAEAMRGRDGRFTWRRLELVPPEVCGAPVHVLQLRLECLRWHDDLPLVPADHLLIRAAGFSDRVRELALTDDEARVVTLIDGVSTAGELVRRAAVMPSLTQAAVARLVELGLVRARAAERSGSAQPDDVQVIVVVDPDDDGFIAALARHVAELTPTAGVIAIDGRAGVDAVWTPRPTAVVVDATTYAPLALELAATAARHGSPRVIAVLDDDGPSVEPLRSAGCVAVLVKPLHILDLQQALTGPVTGAVISNPR